MSGAAQSAADLAAREAAYEQELKTRPSAEGWQRLGLVRHLQNKFDAALPAFRHAVRLDPSLWTSHLFLGICLYRTNQFAQALASLHRAERLAPASGPGRDDLDYWLGATRIANRNPLGGLQDIERLLKRNPAHVEALQLATETYADVSSALWNDVAERNLESAPGWQVHGQALESEGDQQGALDAYQRSMALNPKRAGPRTAIGRLLLAQGKTAEAVAILREEMMLAPGSAQASYYAGLAAIQLGRHAEAAPLLEVASLWARNDPEAAIALAQVYLALRDPVKAANAAARAVEADPTSAAAHELLVGTLEQNGLTTQLEQERRRWQERKRKSQQD